MSPFSVKRIFYASEGCHDFLSKVFVSQYRKKTVDEHFCAVLQKNSGSEKLYGLERGVSRISDENFLFHNAENFRN